MAEDLTRLRELVRERAIRLGDFVLSSGRRSTYYADCRQVTFWPEGAYLVGRALFDVLRDRDVAAVGGPAMAAVTMIAALAVVSHQAGQPLPGFVVRKETKEHGTRQSIEGALPAGGRVAIVDDTMTTGGSLFLAIDAVEAVGCTVDIVLTILDRQEGGAEIIRARGYEYRSLMTVSDIGITPNPSA